MTARLPLLLAFVPLLAMAAGEPDALGQGVGIAVGPPVVSTNPLQRYAVQGGSYPILGRGNSRSPVEIVVFSDYACPYCGVFDRTLEQIEAAYGKKVAVHFRDFPLKMHPDAYGAHLAARCAQEQGRFSKLHPILMANPTALGSDVLSSYAQQAGLDVVAFANCLQSRRHSPEVDADLLAGQTLGLRAAPASFVNGRYVRGARSYDEVVAIVNEELAMDRRPPPNALPPIDPPTNSSKKPADPEPEASVEVGLGDLPPLGELASAQVTMVMFLDLQCPFSKKLARVLRDLQTDYHGRVAMYVRDFPLSFHKQAFEAHVAARCAGRQDRFWEMFELILDNQSRLGEEGIFLELAGLLNLNPLTFQSCQIDETVADQVRADIEAGKALGVTGTPTTYVNGWRINGARSGDEFSSKIDDQLMDR